MLYVIHLLNENSYYSKMWMWILLALVAVVAYVAMNYSQIKVPSKGCSSCPNKKASFD
jgi:hypothetical protein